MTAATVGRSSLEISSDRSHQVCSHRAYAGPAAVACIARIMGWIDDEGPAVGASRSSERR